MATLTLELAQRALQAALRRAEEIGSPSSIAIVDSGRNLVAFARMDDALLASIEISQGKAYTARSMNMNTGDVGPLTQPGQPLYGIETSHARPLITFAGGRPLRVGDEVVGAVGVAGGTVDQDDDVAAAAVASLGVVRMSGERAMQLQQKLAVITGAATGIGRATALLFAHEGAAVVIGDINEEGGQQTVADIEADGGCAWFVRCDVTRSSDVEALMRSAAEAMGGIDIVVNNAGAQRSGRVTEFSEEEWDMLMRVNPRSSFLGVKYGVPHLRQRGGGVIVNVASLAGLKGGPGMSAYSASKGAIVAFTKALAPELAPDGIRINAMCPGWIDTPFNQPAIDFMGGRAAQDTVVQQIVPLARQGTPEEIASGMLFLASDASSYMTGQTLVIDGGVL